MCDEGQQVKMATLLLNARANVDFANKNGWTALQTAAEFAALPLVQHLLDHGASPHVTDRKGLTALHWAAASSAQRTVDVVRVLLLAGGDPQARTKEKRGRSEQPVDMALVPAVITLLNGASSAAHALT